MLIDVDEALLNEIILPVLPEIFEKYYKII